MWKTFGGHCIHQTQSGLKVYQNFFYRWLTFDSKAIQTLLNRRSPERGDLKYIKQLALAVRAQPADCCLLGLGGAAVAHLLAKDLGKAKFIVVENNDEVIQIATTYFMTERLKNMTVTHQDAHLFVQQCDIRYKHLLIDLFDAHSFPVHCNTPDFFAHCRRILLPDGIVALNIANLHEQWPIFQHIKQHFYQRTVLLPVKGTANIVILACNSSSIVPLLDLLKNSGYLKKLSWDSTWGCIAEI
jgi:spermidine synthase